MRVKVIEKNFKLYVSAEEIEVDVARVAEQMSSDLGNLVDEQGRNVLLMPVLNGAYMFAADLSRKLSFDAEICFVKFSSYSGVSSSGQMKELIGAPDNISGRNIVIVEDVVDTGFTMKYAVEQLYARGAASVRVCTYLFKPGKLQANINIDYYGRVIADDFVVGYGLDYNQKGRHFKDIYIVDE